MGFSKINVSLNPPASWIYSVYLAAIGGDIKDSGTKGHMFAEEATPKSEAGSVVGRGGLVSAGVSRRRRINA